ncbi:MAG TPA: beta-ketoacyl synthase N-terminal-like domain-containing protein, partial [Thermoanaerobaculia bacterium]|nr:beta-ketoacyl synthase N-terminal-like domain-containing protein [Thermoanaerobaculia bacterium]
MRRVGIFGWGLVAPRSPNIDRFAENLDSSESWLTPFNGFGPDNFLVGVPEFSFEDYRGWIAERFPPARFHQIEEKMDLPVLYAIGSFIQALGQNPGLEQELRALGTAAHVYMGTGIGCVQTIADNTRALDRAQRKWDRFWAGKNPALAEHLAGRGAADGVPPNPDTFTDSDERYDAESAWWHYWAASSPDLAAYLQDLAEIEGMNVQGDIDRGKVSVMKEKQRRLRHLHEKWGEPTPPWSSVSANVVWNIWNTPAAQISMMGHITGLSFAPVAACSTFGVCLKLGMDAIRRGEAKAVVVGATDPPPIPLSVSTFYAARVISADKAVSKPLTGLRGTHVAGGSVLWIL